MVAIVVPNGLRQVALVRAITRIYTTIDSECTLSVCLFRYCKYHADRMEGRQANLLAPIPNGNGLFTGFLRPECSS